MALGKLQDDPDNEAVWNELSEAVTAPGVSNDEVERLLGAARARHEHRRDWDAVARMLELEISFASGSAVEAPMQAELARVLHEELVETDRAIQAFKRLLQLRPDDPTATEALENDEAKRAKWSELVARYVAEAAEGDDAFRSSLFASAADVAYRYGGEAALAQVDAHLEQSLKLDRRNRRAANLAEVVYAHQGKWADVARVQRLVLEAGATKDERVAAGLRLGRTLAKKLHEQEQAVEAMQAVLDNQPGQPEALSFLAEAYSTTEQWDHLVALYEDQLRGGGVRPGDEHGILVQIAMVHWRMRNNPAAAEPYFDRVRRADPAHGGMLSFFREVCSEKGDKARLGTILTDAQRALPDGAEKRALATEIAKLAESQENAHKAIEQYKQVLRADPENREAREALKRLYTQTEGWNALVELHRQD
ncbi:MAG TPA: hypothetical protein VHB21_28385, partial [Minicystis sp.]|nr:hypothetical protein [Minicystis sp.]